MPGPYFEIVAYKVEDAIAADAERRLAREHVGRLPGFMGWTPFSGAENGRERVDLVTWASLDDARAAGRIAGHDPGFAAFRSTVSQVMTMAHYTATDGLLHAAGTDGIEIARFRLKPGVDEKTMRAAHAAMIATHLAHLDGWQAQHLAKLEDGVFIDLTFAESPEHAKEICARWQGNEDCETFLAMIDLVTMDFGRVLQP